MNNDQPSNLRCEPRDPIPRRAQVNYQGAWTPCMIQDISNHGFGILCAKPLVVGQVIDLRCEQYPGKEFHCQAAIKHVQDSLVGLLITEISESGRDLCMQMMRDYHSDRTSRKQ